MSVNLVLFFKLFMWLSRDKCTRHTIYRLLRIVNVNNMAAPVKENRKRSLSDVTAFFNQNRESVVSKRTVQRTLYKHGYFRKVVRKRIRIREVNRNARLFWCRSNRHKTVDNYWGRFIFTDECKVYIR